MLKQDLSITYINTLPILTLSYYNAEKYPILKPYRTIPYLITLTNYTLSKYIIEVYSTLIHYRNIFSHGIKSRQYPQVV